MNKKKARSKKIIQIMLSSICNYAKVKINVQMSLKKANIFLTK